MPLQGRFGSLQSAEKTKTVTSSQRASKYLIPVSPLESPFHFGFCEDPNVRRRRRMEDAHAFFYNFAGKSNCGFFAIYDGHGGKSAADWCSANLHTIFLDNWGKDPDGKITQILDRTFMDCDEKLDPAHGIFSGCTAIVALILPIKDNKCSLFTANVGDARVVLCRRGKAIRLSFDHQARVPEEKQRIRDCGGIVINDRVNGTLAVTRALGDASMKEFITGHPYTTETTLSADDSFIILACDGLWDICTDQEACDYIRDDIDDPQRCAELLTDFALEQGSTDNLSVIVVRLASQSSGRMTDEDQEDKITHHDPHAHTQA